MRIVAKMGIRVLAGFIVGVAGLAGGLVGRD